MSLFGEPPAVDPLQEAVTDILHRDWDPLPNTPRGEYAEVVDRLVVLIGANADTAAMVAVLNDFEDGLGLEPIDTDRHQRVAEALIRQRPDLP